jgi:uncharacterized cupin superfamily protein
MSEVVTGDGWAIGTLDDLGDGPGFRKIRRALGVTAFGINAIVQPAGVSGPFHFHDTQEETYFVHAGEIEIEFGEGGERHRLGPGGLARVDAATHRRIHSVGSEDAVYVIVGGADGYVGRDGRTPE